MAGAALGRCWHELYHDPCCLIGEAPESRKDVSTLANSLVSTVCRQYSLVIQLELGVPSGTWSCPNCVSVPFSPCFFGIELSLVWLYLHSHWNLGGLA